jgi:hypothetical protein
MNAKGSFRSRFANLPRRAYDVVLDLVSHFLDDVAERRRLNRIFSVKL